MPKKIPKELTLDQVSPLAQNYLITLYMLGDDQDMPPTASRLAEQLAKSPITEHLGTSIASVTAMVRRMQRDGLLEITKEKHIAFSEAGRRLAEQIMRRHQLAERMLVDMLGMELHKVHAEAHRWEHAISPDVEAKLVERLGNPLTCPFGHPIPGNGYRPPASAVRLNKVQPNTTVVVERIPEYDPRLVQYLVTSGVVRGQRLTVREVAAFKGTITLDVNGKEVVVGVHVAPSIVVHSPTPSRN
ncbi:MAG: metal-dependent transcriptional regulator [Chloroflexi bacterium]|nr:metal-dependent transcriptional regulator [Chloroflexota bacterium]